MDECEIKVSIESKLSNLPLVRKTIRGICSSVVQSEDIFQDIELAMNEALSNVISHAYRNEPGHEIEIIVKLYPHEIAIEIIDFGKSAEAALKPQKNLDPLAETGRGLSLMYKLMNEVVYNREKNKNVLVLRKTF